MRLTSPECQKTWIIYESSLFGAYGLATIDNPLAAPIAKFKCYRFPENTPKSMERYR